jgi:hypothetical protein
MYSDAIDPFTREFATEEQRRMLKALSGNLTIVAQEGIEVK